MFDYIDANFEALSECKNVDSSEQNEREGSQDMNSKISKSIGQSTFEDLQVDCMVNKMKGIVIDDSDVHSPFVTEAACPKATAPADIGDIFPEITWRWNIPDACATAIVSLEPPYRFRTVNAAFEALTLFKLDELLGSSFRLLCGPDTNEKTLSRIFRRISRGDFSSNSRSPVSIYRKDGDDVSCCLRAFASPPPNGFTECTVAMQPFIGTSVAEQTASEQSGCSQRSTLPEKHVVRAQFVPAAANPRIAATMAAKAAKAAA